MKRFSAKQSAAAIAVVSIFCAVAAMAWPAGARKWRVDVMPASYVGDVSIVAGAAGEISFVRWHNVGATTNDISPTVKLVSAADGWESTLATMAVTNAKEVATSMMVSTNDVMWRIGDKLRVSGGATCTNGTLAIGYFYYE